MITKRQLITSLAIIIGILLVVNLLSNEYFLRLDFTEDNRYTLSDATENIIEELDKPVTVKAYFSKGLPPQANKVKRRFREMLVEYANLSDDMLAYNFINPADKQTQREIAQKGIRPVMINVQKEGGASQQRAFMGAEIKYGSKSEVIPLIEPGAAMEYSLSKAIKKLTVEEKPDVAIIQGHGEPMSSKLGQVKDELNVLYDVSTHTMSNSSAIPQKYETIAIVAPKDSLSASHLQQLDQYLANGGKIFFALDRVKGDLKQTSASDIKTNIFDWLEEKGIKIQNAFLYDKNSGAVSVQSGGSNLFSSVNRIKFPYLPIIKNFADHPITGGLEQILFKFTSPLQFTGDSTLTFTPLAYSSKNAGTKPVPFRFNIRKDWTQRDFNKSKLPVGAALEGNISGNTSSKIVVFSDGDFPQSAGQQNRRRRRQQKTPGVDLMVNSIDWLSDDIGLVNLRTKEVTSRPIESMESSQKQFLMYLNFLLPILIILIYGAVRAQIKRNVRLKRMEEHYA